MVEVRRSHAAKQREARKKDKQRKQEEAGKKKLEEMKRKQEVLRVKNWRMRIQLKTNTKDPDRENKNSTEKNNSPFQTSSAERRAISRARKTLPKSPRRKARILEKLVESPSSRKSLEKKGVLPTAETQTSLKISEGIIRSLVQQLNEVKPTGGASTSRRTAYGILKNIINKSGKFARTSLQKKLDLRKEKPKKVQETEWWKPKTRKPRKDRVPDQVKERIKEFFLSPAVSREVPDKRAAIKIKDKKTSKVRVVQRHYMSMSIQDAHTVYKQLHPEDKIGLTSFSRLRPIQVKTVTKTNRRTCLCQQCCNAALKLEALKKFANAEGSEVTILKSKRDIIKATLCPYNDEQPKVACLNRSCENCGPKLLGEYYSDLVTPNKDKDIAWNKWEYITINKEESSKRVVSCVTKSTSLDDFMKEFIQDMHDLLLHVFRADWQHKNK